MAKKIRTNRVKVLLDNYIECALWTGVTSNDPEANDNVYGCSNDQITKESLATMKNDCVNFLSLVKPFMANYKKLVGDGYLASMGHDFWLTRNGHGAGFWDRGHGELGKELTKIAKSFGECNGFLTEQNQIIFE